MSVSAGIAPAVPADTAPHARREVYDALHAAGGTLTTRTLRRRISHRLQARVGGEIELAGGFDKYLEPKLALFVAENMITINGDQVTLTPDFELWIPSVRHRAGRYLYTPGSQPAIDTVSGMDHLITARRANGGWDCLPPQSTDRGRRATVRASLSTLGWDITRPVLTDRAGVHIDGRMRLAEFELYSGKNALLRNGTRKSWTEWKKSPQHIHTDERLTPSLGVLRSYFENKDRLTDTDNTEYLDRLGKMGVDLDKLRPAAAVYLRLDKSVLQGEPPLVVTLPNGYKVTTDGESIQLRSLTSAAPPLKYDDAIALRRYLESHGYEVEPRTWVDVSNGNKTRDESLFAGVADLVELLGNTGTDPGWVKLYPSSAERRAALLGELPRLLDVPVMVERAVAAL